MSHVRIRCEMPKIVRSTSTGPVLVFDTPSIGDCSVSVVADDGKEHPIHGVTGISWSIRRNEAPRAVLELEGPWLDVVLPERRG